MLPLWRTIGLFVVITFTVTGAAIREEDVAIRVVPCSSWSNSTKHTDTGWYIDTLSSTSFSLRNGDLCLDANTGVPVLSPCHQHLSQQWRNMSQAADPKGWTFQSVSDGRCLMVATTSYTLGPGLLLATCNPTQSFGPQIPPSQHWSVNPSPLGDKGFEIASRSKECCGNIFWKRPVCLAANRFPNCGDRPLLGQWCDVHLSPTARAEALLGHMTLQEKASNMDSFNFGVPRYAAVCVRE